MLRLAARAEPATGMSSSKPNQATVEDYFSDDGHGHGHGHGIAIEPFTPDPPQANVRTKRSNPDDMGTTRPATARVPAHCDVKSDSGYSSQSVAGLSSADSAASAASSQRSPPAAPKPASPTPAQKPARPAHARQQSAQSTQSTQSTRTAHTASRHAPSRGDSLSSRRPPADRRPPAPPQQPPAPAPRRRDSRNVDECKIPGCHCGPADAVAARPRPQRRQSMLHTALPADSAPDVSYSHPHVYDTRSQVSDPAHYQASSPREGRPPARYHTSQGGPVVQPATTRRPSVSGRPPRPTSYHGDANYNWSQSAMPPAHPNSPYERGPPPSRSAWGTMPYPPPQINSPHMPHYPNQPPAAFYQAKQMQPTREQQHPYPHALPQTSAYAYPAPQLVTQVGRTDRNLPSARYHSNAPPPPPAQHQQPRINYRDQEQDDFESGSESGTESDEEPEPEYQYRRSQKGAPQQRPNLRHAKTTPAPPLPQPKRPQTVVISGQRTPRPHDHDYDPRPPRRTSVSRPPLVPSIKAKSAYDTPQARVIVEGSRGSRRESLQAYDRTFQEHRRAQQVYNQPSRATRSSKVYDNVVVGHDYERDYRDDDEEAESVARISRRRRDTDTESRRGSHRPVELRQAVAEDYISSNRGDREALADQSYEIAKRKSSRASGGPSEAESSRSRGSDKNGDLRIRIGNDAPVTLSLNGDMEGRTLQLVSVENGMNELVISSNTRGESTYRSERSSVRGDRRALMPAGHQARRDAEEFTERSSHSSRRRRETRGEQDEPRRLLHRSARRGERSQSEYQY